jgi:formate--tetrahydrofolate ligase
MLREDPNAVIEGASNLRKQIENVRKHGIAPVIYVNHFPTDHPSEVDAIFDLCKQEGVRVALATHWAEGGKGAVDLARVVEEACREPGDFHFLYPLDQPIKAKIACIATEIYGAGQLSYEPLANAQIAQYEKNGYGNLPICMAKTHLSLTADPSVKGAPSGFTLPIREVRASVGAGFIYPIVGEMRTMPGLPSHPAAENVDVDLETGRITGLF